MRRRLDPEQRRAEILQAARHAFATRPYDAVHVDAIAREAGASRALVGHYFGDKRGLFLAVARDIVGRVPRTVRADLVDLPVEQMVDANTRLWLDLIEANRETSLIFLGAGPVGRDPELEALQDELRDRVAERMLVNHLRTLDLPPAACVTMRAALGMFERALRDWILGRSTREQVHAIIANGILATVRHVLPAVLALDDEP